MSEDPTVFVVDDDDAVRDSLQVLLEAEGYRTEGFASARAFLDAYAPGRPGCLVADVRMPDMSGLELQEVVVARRLAVPMVIVTGHADVPMAVRAMKAGAVDFIEKPFTDMAILDAVRRALAVQHTGDDGLAAVAAARIAILTPREREVLDGLVRGQANKVIAFELAISPRTVEIHRARVMEKMQADSLPHLVRLALAAKIEPDT